MPILIVFFIIIASMALAEEAIIYQDFNKGITAIYGDCKERKIIDDKALYFIVCPNGKYIVAYQDGCFNYEECIVRIYNLDSATVETVNLPFGDWAHSWWSDDSKRFCVNRSLSQTDHGPACRNGDETFGCAMRAILQVAAYDIQEKKFFIEKEFSPGKYTLLADYEKDKNYKAPPPDIFSPDGEWKLSWGDRRPEWQYVKHEVVLESLTNGLKKLVFRQEDSDFAPAVWVSSHPWSIDSKGIVLSKSSGFFRTIILFSGPSVYSVDVESLKWRRIGKGDHAFWLPNVPRIFAEVK